MPAKWKGGFDACQVEREALMPTKWKGGFDACQFEGNL